MPPATAGSSAPTSKTCHRRSLRSARRTPSRNRRQHNALSLQWNETQPSRVGERGQMNFCLGSSDDQGDLVHEDEWELDGRFASYRTGNPCAPDLQSAQLLPSSTIIRTYGGCRPCQGSSKLRSRKAQPKPPP